MEPVVNKPNIEKCILSFSHDRFSSRKSADRISIEKARREIAAGKKGVSHLILRAEDDAIDRLKFLFLIRGVPLMCYALMNLLLSSVKEVVVIGSEEVRRVLERFLEIAGDHGKIIRFAPEKSENLSLLHTLQRGREHLTLDARELVLFQPGDLPFLYDIEKIVQDRDIRGHDLILWLNSRQAMFPRYVTDEHSEFVQRNYHYRVIDEDRGELHDIKEPNTYPINLHAIETDIIELLHNTRKDGKILRAGLIKALTLPLRLFHLLPVLADHFLRFPADMRRLRPGDSFPFGMHLRNFNRGAAVLLNTAFTAKMHGDPALVSDIDALEDWEDFESLIHHAERECGEDGLTRIHPGGEILLTFREKAMPQLIKELPMFRNFPQYMNGLYRDLEMEYAPFNGRGEYAAPNQNQRQVRHAFDWYSKRTEQFKNQPADQMGIRS